MINESLLPLMVTFRNLQRLTSEMVRVVCLVIKGPVVAAVGWIWMSSRSFRRSISAAATEIPLGVKSFAELVSTGFVDKTAKVAGLVVRNKSFFFSRPRRFGKSLALDTAVCMLEGKKELFTNTVSFLWFFFPSEMVAQARVGARCLGVQIVGRNLENFPHVESLFKNPVKVVKLDFSSDPLTAISGEKFSEANVWLTLLKVVRTSAEVCSGLDMAVPACDHVACLLRMSLPVGPVSSSCFRALCLYA